MSPVPAKRHWPKIWVLLLIGAMLALVIAANIHLVTVAMTSQPACVPTDPDRPPAKILC